MYMLVFTNFIIVLWIRVKHTMLNLNSRSEIVICTVGLHASFVCSSGELFICGYVSWISSMTRLKGIEFFPLKKKICTSPIDCSLVWYTCIMARASVNSLQQWLEESRLHRPSCLPNGLTNQGTEREIVSLFCYCCMKLVGENTT